MPRSLFLLLLTVSAYPAFAKNSNNLSAGLLYFDYEEFHSTGFSLNHETGFIPGFNLSIIRNQHDFSFSLYKGSVDYDGYTQALTPHQTDTDETLNKLAYRYYLQPNQTSGQNQYYLGLSHHFWFRDIQSNNGVSGLEETYTWLQAEAGIQATALTNATSSVLVELGLLYTFNGNISIDLNDMGFGSPDLELGNNPGIHANVVWRFDRSQTEQIEIGINYSYWEFGQSNSKTLSNGFQTITIYEPRSESSHVLFYIGLNHQF